MKQLLPSTCFFLCSMAYTLGWTTVSSLLSHYKLLYGKQILLQLNIAYFLPSVPVLLTQSLYDDWVNTRYGMATATAVRLCVGLGGSALVCAVYPFFEGSRAWVLSTVVLLGLFSGIAFGSSYQLVSKFPPTNSVALTLGYVGSGPIMILIEAAMRVRPRVSHLQLIILFELAALMTLGGLGAAVALLFRFWDKLEDSEKGEQVLDAGGTPTDPLLPRLSVAGRRARSRLPSPLPSLLPREAAGGVGGVAAADGRPSSPRVRRLTAEHVALQLEMNSEATTSRPTSTTSGSLSTASEADMQQLVGDIWPAAASLYLSIGTSILVFPFFTYVPSSGIYGDMLPQVLFAARAVTDIIGRILPRPKWVLTRPSVLGLGIFKAAMTPLFFLYLDRGQSQLTVGQRMPRNAFGFVNDNAAVAYVALFWLLSGYLNTLAYVVAPDWAQPAGRVKAGVVMSLCFQVSCVTALALAFLLEQMPS